MEADEQQYDRLVHRIYDTVGEAAGWKALYADLAALTGASTIHVLAFDKHHDTLSFSDGFNLPVAAELGYIQHYHRLDPRLALLWTQPVLHWMHCHEH